MSEEASDLKATQMWRDGKSEESDDPAEPRVWRDRSVNMWGSMVSPPADRCCSQVN